MSQEEINYDEKIKKENMICPFCDENDFDMIGLKSSKCAQFSNHPELTELNRINRTLSH